MTIFVLICMTAHLTDCFQMYTIEQEKRGLCQYEDKRYLLADLPDGRRIRTLTPPATGLAVK